MAAPISSEFLGPTPGLKQVAPYDFGHFWTLPLLARWFHRSVSLRSLVSQTPQDRSSNSGTALGMTSWRANKAENDLLRSAVSAPCLKDSFPPVPGVHPPLLFTRPIPKLPGESVIYPRPSGLEEIFALFLGHFPQKNGSNMI